MRIEVSTLGVYWVLALGMFAGLVVLLEPILMPFLVGALLAYLGDPWADVFERWGLSRTLAVVLCFLILSVFFLLVLLLIIPALVEQLLSAVERLPHVLYWIQTQWLNRIVSAFDLDLSLLDAEQLRSWLLQHWGKAQTVLRVVLEQIGSSSIAFLVFLGNLALIPVVTFYLLRDFDHLIKKLHDLFPRKMAPKIAELAQECDEVLGAFFKGQLLVMMALGGLYALGLSLVGLEYGLLIGLIAGLASIVPYLGFVVGVSIALVSALFQFQLGVEAFLVVIVFAIGQAVEGMVLTPWLVGDRIGLHPVAVIFAILAGGQLFGMVGVLLALPVGAVIMVFLRHMHDNYLGSAFYTAEQSLEKHLDVDGADDKSNFVSKGEAD